MSSPLGGGGGGSGGLLASLGPMAASYYNYTGKPATGTGIQQIVSFARAQHLLTPVTLMAVVPELPGAFGGYPQNKGTEIGPDALYIGLFAVLMLAHLGMFGFNFFRKHNFFLQLGFAFFCCLKVIGFACRVAWAHNVANINVGICSLVFIQVAQLVLQSLNMVLAHRIFTWRHPETGRHWLIVHACNFIYLLVLAVIVMAILGQALPYLYFMEQHHFNMCKNVMKAAAILNLYYSGLPIQFLLFAYILKPGTIVKTPKILNRSTQQEEHVMPPVYQASWIRSAGLFYYPEKNSQVIIYKGEPGSDAVRIIPSREPPGNGHSRVGERMHPRAPHLHWATVTVTITSVVLMMNTCFRVAACFRTGPWATLVGSNWKVNFWPDHPYVMFIFYGATEVLVLMFYLLMRIDLRFYIPDIPRKPPKDGIPARRITTEDQPIAWGRGDGPQADTTPTNEYEKENGSHESNYSSA